MSIKQYVFRKFITEVSLDEPKSISHKTGLHYHMTIYQCMPQDIYLGIYIGNTMDIDSYLRNTWLQVCEKQWFQREFKAHFIKLHLNSKKKNPKKLQEFLLEALMIDPDFSGFFVCDVIRQIFFCFKLHYQCSWVILSFFRYHLIKG